MILEDQSFPFQQFVIFCIKMLPTKFMTRHMQRQCMHIKYFPHKSLLLIYDSWPTRCFHWLAGRGKQASDVRYLNLTLLKTAYFLWLLINSELTLSKPGRDSYLKSLDHIDRHRLTAPGLEDSIQALLGQNEEEAVQMFLKHAGKFLFQQDRWNMINLNSCRRSTSFNSAWSSPCLWCEDWQHLFDF